MNLKPKYSLPILISALIGCTSDHTITHKQPAIESDVSQTQTQPLEDNSAEYDEIEPTITRHAQESMAKEAKLAASSLAIGRQELGKHKSAKVAHEMAYLPSPDFVNPAITVDTQTAYYQEQGREQYAAINHHPVKLVSSDPVSTFSIDVDTGSYSNIRRMLNNGALPPVDAVRIEEMINYFDYAYKVPEDSNEPFSMQTELAVSPWSKDHALLRIGLKGFEPDRAKRPAANLVFLLDVSGSMNAPNKLPLLKKSLIMLSQQLTDQDKVSIVVYAGASGLVLEPTAGNQTDKIEQALDALAAGGSTNGQAGIQLAYQLAKQVYNPSGINRVILATDGDFNVGISDVEALKKLIEEKREQGISLTTLGFGTGNYNDHLMEQLADVGNGNYAYIDGLNEARKVLVDQLTSTLMTIAKDVKIQIEFNPAWVKEYRLLGYENRALAREDFNNDKVDAGEIGAGHRVTALYELVLQGSEGQRIDPLRYQQANTAAANKPDVKTQELAFIKLRYKALNETTSTLVTRPVVLPAKLNAFDQASEDFRFSATVAAFGETLRNSQYISRLDYNQLIDHALKAKGSDPFGYRSEFIKLLRLAAAL